MIPSGFSKYIATPRFSSDAKNARAWSELKTVSFDEENNTEKPRTTARKKQTHPQTQQTQNRPR